MLALVAQAPEGEEARNGNYYHKYVDLTYPYYNTWSLIILHFIVRYLSKRMNGILGERLIQYATENLVTEVLIHPQTNTLLQCIRNLLASFTKHRHIIHAGYTFGGNGSWILQVLIS